MELSDVISKLENKIKELTALAKFCPDEEQKDIQNFSYYVGELDAYQNALIWLNQCKISCNQIQN